MAKNKSRKTNQTDKGAAKAPEAAVNNSENSASKANEEQKEVLYQVVTKRTSDILKAYITFTYRVLHPNVTTRLIVYGLVVLLPGIFYFKDQFWKIFFITIGLALILLAFFRQYISLSMTKKNDPDYKSGAEFTYNFTSNSADFLKNGERFTGLDKYKDITNFYYDDNFYYLGVRGRELYVLPKKSFTIGDAQAFEEFIYKKCKVTCRWLPDNLKDQYRLRRAYKRLNRD